MKHLGDYDASTVIYGKFSTYRPSTGAAFTLAGSPALSVYKDNSTTQSTTGVTLTADFDSVTGLNHFAIDTSADGTFYSAGSNFDIVITTGTVDSVSVVGSVVASFTIRKGAALKPTVAGRTLDVSTGGEAGIDWANIGSPTTAVNLSGTNIDVDQVVASVSGAVGSVASGGITATSIAADAIGASELAADAVTEIATGVWAAATRTLSAGTNIVLAKGTGITGFNDLDAAGVRTAVGLASANLDTQIGTLATASNLATVAGYLDTEIAAILADTNELQTDWANGGRLDLILDSRASQTSVDTIDGIVDSILVDTAEIGAAGAGLTAIPWNASWDAEVQSEVTDALNAYDPPTNTEMEARTLVAANYATAANLATVDTVVDAIQVTTDKLDDMLVNSSDGWIYTVAALQDAPSGGGSLTAAEIADAVWEEAIADHAGTSGSTAEALNAAGAAGDPWITALPGSYSSGQAGYILGTNLNATVSSRATQTSVDDLPTNAELATALGTADDAILAVLGTPAGASLAADVSAVQSDTNDIQSRLPASLVSGRIDASVGAMASNVVTAAAVASDAVTEIQSGLATASALSTVEGKIDTVDGVVDAILTDTAEIGAAGAGLTALASAANLATVAGYLDTEIAAIKAKTDNLPASPAATGDIPTASAIADAVHDEVVEGTTTLRQSIRLANAALGGKASGLETTEATFRDLADTKDRIVATVDADGNRTAVTRDLT